MIRTSADTPLTKENLKKWINEFNTEYLPNLQENRAYYLNTNKAPLPYAKKIVTISAAATLGEGIDLKTNDNFSEEQIRTFDEIEQLFGKQIISYEDLSIITQGATYGVAYELGFMSNDEKPVPKCKWLDACHTFVVFDDTVEDNALYGIYFNEITESNSKYTDIYVYDKEYKYTVRVAGHATVGDNKFFRMDEGDRVPLFYVQPQYDSVNILIKSPKQGDLSNGYTAEPHYMGRMPITVYFNNNDEQSDFEQVKPAIDARNKIHELAMEDAETIAGNYLVFVGNELAGNTEDEKARTVRKIGRTKVIEIGEGEDVKILTKQETFSMVSVYGKDVENKIYDLSMIINFSSDEFSGNITGVALRLKLFPFKRLIKNKDYFIEKLYRRRLKMYMHALTSLHSEYAEFDVSDIKVNIKRTWEENILELAQVIGTLAPTGLFSDKYLIEKMPDGEYEVEIQQKEKEGKSKSVEQVTSVGLDNSYLGDYAAILREYGNGSNNT